jgi:hypothetical protein
MEIYIYSHMYYYYSNLIEELDHVELTGADHQIARDAKHQVWFHNLRLSINETWSDSSDQVTVVMIDLLYTPILNKIISKYMFSR